MTQVQLLIGLVALAAVVALVPLVNDWSGQRVVLGGFWFDDGVFELPRGMEDAGGRFTDEELRTIEDVARAELYVAYTGLRISFSDTRDALYRVGVIQRFSPRRGRRRGAVAETVAMGALGGQGAISFAAVARYAVSFAPPDADRDMIVAGIGRGIGRAAAHEFAHQLLTGVPLHAGSDVASYELAWAGRVAQFYGPMHWEFARPLLLERLGAAG